MLFSLNAFATHNRAGEITYRKLNGTTYEITVTTYTDTRSTQADRCEIGIKFGDGKEDTIPRINHTGGAPCNPSVSCSCMGDGIGNSIKKNVYQTRHTYAGPGTYIISMEDPNRVEGIKNIPKSVGIPFFIKSTLIIAPSMGSNNSPVLNFPPIDQACTCNPFYHNPGAVDPDGDSLSYSLSVCYGRDGKTIPGYYYPRPICPKNTFSIDPKSGTLSWDGPGQVGQFNACILITEWRKEKTSGKWRIIGEVLRDMQIDVLQCNNQPPQFINVEDVCVNAGDTISEVITAYDTDGQTITLTGTGEPISLINSPAKFFQGGTGIDTVRTKFYWQTQCSHIRNADYQMTFKAEDNAQPVKLVNFMTVNMRVVGPAVTNLSSSAGRNRITLNWDPSICINAQGYEIYRKVDSTNWTPINCEIGIPTSLGYSKIDYVAGHGSSSYVDDNKGVGLFHGQIYCYRIVAKYADNASGYSSEEICNELPFDVPIITRSSVNITDISKGSDSVSFAKPQLIDLNKFPPPYSFNVSHSEGYDDAERIIYESPLYLDFNEIDTILNIEGLNTKEQANTFIVELFSADSSIGKTHTASSVYLDIGSDDKKLHLEWKMEVPWKNFEYVIYREIEGLFTAIDTVADSSYIDSNLVNEREYRYLIKSQGKYSIEELPDTIVNFSQIQAGIPKDTIPPCAPDKPFIDSKCEYFSNHLVWKNPNSTCNYKDAVRYNVYFTPFVGSQYQVLESKTDINDTIAQFDDLESVAGCYAITAIDTFGNESSLSERVCVDNCPIYELPNVFTPGGDGHNDYFHPLPYRYIKDIEFVVFNRWGQQVYDTTDPAINWDGTNKYTNKPCLSGVYFYICVVNEIRLSGIRSREIKGHITILNQLDRVSPSK